MDTFQLIGFAGALILGWVMGTTGSGGSALAVPMFNYLFHMDMHASSAHGLFVVGFTALAGAVLNLGKQGIDWGLSLIFSVPMIFTVYLVRRFLVPMVPKVIFQWGPHGPVLDRDMVFMLLFGLLLAISALTTIRDRRSLANIRQEPGHGRLPIALLGIGIGVLTGITGMGGGFLIVPVLLIFLKLPFKKAIATSLMIVALKSLGGFLGDLGQIDIDWILLSSFTGLSLIGMCIGFHCTHRLTDKTLKGSFGYFALGISFLVIFKELSVWV